MRGFMLDQDGVGLRDVEPPHPPPHGAVLDVLAAGVCHSDLSLMRRDPASHPFALPLVLGHEVVGEVRELGVGTREDCMISVGDRVAVYGPVGCGSCVACSRGAENFCPVARERGIFPSGLGAPGGLADRMAVRDVRQLVPVDDLEPTISAPLTDAGLTAYAAVRPTLPRLHGGAALVIGVGGLGHLAIQLLTRVAGSLVVAVDVREDGRRLAEELGAVTATPDSLKDTMANLGLQGFDVVLDMVGTDESLQSGAAALLPGGDLAIVGVGEGRLPVSVGSLPLGAHVRTVFWGTREELHAVVGLARRRLLTPKVATYTLANALRAYEDLAGGAVVGRAVVTP